MAKSNTTQIKNLLRLSGLVFAWIGVYHLLRSRGYDFRFVELTRLGSLVYGMLILLLAAGCFWSSKN